MFVYHFVDPGGWEYLWKVGGSRRKGYWFLNKGLRHFNTFALVVQENVMYNLSAISLFNELSLVKALYTFPKFICCHCESYENEAIANCEQAKIHKRV